MEYRALAHNIRKSVGTVDDLTAALDQEGIPYQVTRNRINIGGDEYQTRVNVLVPYAGGWESCKPFYVRA